MNKMNTNLYTLSIFIIFQTTTCTLTVARLFHVLRRSQKQHLVSYNHHPSELNTGNVKCAMFRMCQEPSGRCSSNTCVYI